MEIGIGLIISAFIAGLLMFLAPCTLPLVPAYVAFIGGVGPDAVKGQHITADVQRKLLLNAAAFVIGFSAVFIIFGVLAGLFGSFVGQFRSTLTQFAGIFIILFGLMMLNVIKIGPLMRERKVALPHAFTPGNPVSSTLVGSTFALGWTPCVGPVLASILLLASTSTTALQGGLFLAVFSAGLAVPFLLTALLYAQATRSITRYDSVVKRMGIVGGVFLIFIGTLLLTDSFGLTVEYGYRVFEFFGFEDLFEYY